jgi:predicted signal transduction protein with EAL and GGDEF domain
LEAVRNADIVSRLGGDEFVIVLPQLSSGIAAINIVNNIRKILSQTYSIDGRDLYITPSIGISVFPHDGATIKELMQNADLAMYDAKAKGRDNYQFFKKEMNTVAQEKHLMESDLRSAIDREEFLLHYQPQIDVATGRVVGVEALVRWQHPFRGFVQPDMFIGIAEDTGLILPLGAWVLKTACLQSAAWTAAGLPPMRMAVNLSARQFRQDNLPKLVADTIAETGIAPHLLELEITESVAMDNPEETNLHLRRFKEMGVELAIDDFGTGYSSLSYLKLYPVNRLKIDRSFVKDIETSADDSAIAEATISLAHALGKEVVAEGVETEGQLNFLRKQKCDIIQGYYYSRPLPAAELAEFLRKYFPEKGCEETQV